MAKWDLFDDLLDKTNVEDNMERRGAMSIVDGPSVERELKDLGVIAPNANERQVGGTHYRTSGSVQHWDLFGPDYLIGYATKYMRWRKKGGIEDLEKAIHVIEKLKERLRERARPTYDRASVATWCDGAGLDWTERRIVHLIMFGFEDDSLDEAIAGIRHLISTHAPKVVATDAVKIYTTMTDDEFRAEMKRRPPLSVAEQRTPEDGAQHAALAPWIVNEAWFEDKKNITPELRAAFFRGRGMGCVTLLEPHVESDKMPKQLAGVYRMMNNGWHLRIETCPSDAREHYPNLPRERNAVEIDEMPRWQRCMYEWIEDECKHRLRPEHNAWTVETE